MTEQFRYQLLYAFIGHNAKNLKENQNQDFEHQKKKLLNKFQFLICC